MTSRPVKVIVVAYHAADVLDRALDALGSGPAVTVVDNSLSEGVRSSALAHGARYIRAERNLGFAGGVDLALRELLEGDPCDVLLLNPDAAITGAGVAELSAALEADGRLAAVAPHLVNADGASQRVTWPFPTPWRAWVEAVGLGRLAARADFLVGAVLLLRWEALREVGLLDERFFLYAEEADWQRRATRAGWRVALDPSVTAMHHGGGTGTDPLRREVLFHAGQETYIRKWYGNRGWLVYRAAVIAGALVRAVAPRRARRREAWRRLLLYLRGPQRLRAGAGIDG